MVVFTEAVSLPFFCVIFSMSARLVPAFRWWLMKISRDFGLSKK